MDNWGSNKTVGGGSARDRVPTMERGLGIVASRCIWSHGVQLSILGAETSGVARIATLCFGPISGKQYTLRALLSLMTVLCNVVRD